MVLAPNSLRDAQNLVIAEIGARWQAQSDREQSFRHTVRNRGGILKYRLAMHGLPQRPALDIFSLQALADLFTIKTRLCRIDEDCG